MSKFARVAVGVAVAFAGLWPVLAVAQGTPKISFESPKAGSAVRGPKVTVKVKIENFKTVDAGAPVKAGEGHAHILVDRDAKAGDILPTDQPSIVHFGKAPYDTRDIELQPGSHTVTAVLGDSSHKVLDVASAKVTFSVAPAQAANTGDGSLADGGPGVALVGALVLGGVALGSRAIRRRI